MGRDQAVSEPSGVPAPKCPKCGSELIQGEYEQSDLWSCPNPKNLPEGCFCGATDELYYLMGMEAAREAIRPINDAEENDKVAEGPWGRLCELIKRVEKESK
jgi:hypothetical protein